ncbi:hypothetical protein RCIP0073_00074 [Klebsiella phage RCIP0073]
MNRSYHFPFVVHSRGVGTFRYQHRGDRAIFTNPLGVKDRAPSQIPITHFLNANATSNPDNVPTRDYYISEGYGPAPECSTPSIAEAMRYAEESARNMFGRDESRGIVNFGFYGGGLVRGGLVDGIKIKSPSEVAALVNVKTIGIEDAFIQNGEIKSAKLSGRAGFVIASDNFATFSAPTKEQALRKEVDRLTGELTAAHATIQKVREALRTQDGEDVQAHAKVLRQMADALVKLWNSEV